MLEAAKESSGLIDGIATASREQAFAIEKVSEAVRALDEMTQHNAALVEETNAAIEQTEAQAVELDQVVAIFHLSSESVAKPVSKAPAAVRAKPQVKVKQAAKAYLTEGSAAVDWTEF